MTRAPSATAAALREAFDRSFAEAPPTPAAALTGFLAVRIGADPYAIRLSDVVSLHRDRVIVPLIHFTLGFLGIAGFRGVVAPIYDLRALLGYPSGALFPWLVLCRATEGTLGLAFDQFESHVQGVIEVVPGRAAEGARRHFSGVVRAASATRPVIHLASLIEAIRHKEP